MFWKIKRELSHIHHRIKDGVSYKDTWNLDLYIDEVTYKGIMKLKEVKDGFPLQKGMNLEKWDEILDDMIEGFKLSSKGLYEPKNTVEGCEDFYYTEEEWAKIDKARNLYNKYRSGLWR